MNRHQKIVRDSWELYSNLDCWEILDFLRKKNLGRYSNPLRCRLLYIWMFWDTSSAFTFSFESCVDLLGNVHAADNRTHFPALVFFASTVFWLSADLSQVKVTTIKIEFHDQTTLSVWKLFTRVLRCSLYCYLEKRTPFLEKCKTGYKNNKVQQTWFCGVLGSIVGLIMF